MLEKERERENERGNQGVSPNANINVPLHFMAHTLGMCVSIRCKPTSRKLGTVRRASKVTVGSRAGDEGDGM